MNNCDILLINPPSSTYKNLSTPLGLLYLATYVNQVGFQAEILDLSVCRKSFDEIIKIIKKKNPKIIGISFFTVHFNFVKDFSPLLKRELPAVKIIVGGPHPTALPELTLKSIKEIDMAVIGEGELTLRKLLEARERLYDIGGIAYKLNEQIIINPRGQLIDNLDILPFPDFHLLNDLSSYQLSCTWEPNKPSAVMMTSRGCPYDCIYCASKVMWTRRVRFRSAENVLTEIEKLVADFGIREILFYDDTFLINKNRLMEICHGLMGKNISWACLGRVDAVSEDILRLMKKSGCHMISFGVESANQEVLEAINKNVKKQQIIDAFKICHKVKISTKASFIFGSPKETIQSINETKNTLFEIMPDYVFFFMMTPLPGTLLFKYHEKNNLLDGEWIGFDQTTYQYFYDTNLTYEELRQVISKSYKNYYFSFFFLWFLLTHLSWRKIKTLFNIFIDLLAFFKYIKFGQVK